MNMILVQNEYDYRTPDASELKTNFLANLHQTHRFLWINNQLITYSSRVLDLLLERTIAGGTILIFN